MKKFLLLLVMLIPVAVCAQENNEKKQTKYEEITFKSGEILKYEDINFTKIITRSGSSIQTYIRIVHGSPNYYFYVLSKSDNGSLWSNPNYNGIALIEYNDLVEVNKALDKIYSETKTDLETSSDFLMNKFVTDDGFVVGHYVRKKQGCSFVRLERYSDPIDIASYSKLISTFKEAQAKIEELKKE